MNPAKWTQHFADFHRREEHFDWTLPCELHDEKARRLLADSLAIFQLGETGDGSTLKRWAARAETRGDVPRGYAEAAAAFIAEENRHSALLAIMVRHLGGTLKENQWSAWAFNRARKLLPALEFELQVLLTAELIARAYYGLLSQRLEEPLIRRACASLTCDEVGHIAFHIDLFRHRFKGWLPLFVDLWSAQFQALYLIAEAIVWWDHGAALTACGISKPEFQREGRRACAYFLRKTISDLSRSVTASRSWKAPINSDSDLLEEEPHIPSF